MSKKPYRYNEKKDLYVADVQDPAGKWHQVSSRTLDGLFAKKAAVQGAFEQKHQEQTAPFVAQYCATWFELNTAELTEKGKEGYRASINKHICPVIGGMQIADVGSDDVRRVLAVMQKAGLSAATQSRALRLMRRIFAAAEDAGLISRDPTRRVKAGGKPPAEKEALSKEQEQRLLRTVSGLRVETFCRLALHAGLRREEALGLRWDCVHLDDAAPYIAVRRALHWPHNNKAEVSEQLKSKAARRDVPIPDDLADHLRAVKAASTSDYVCPDTQGEALSYSAWAAMWGAIKARTSRTIKRQQDGEPVEVQLRVGDKVPNRDIMISLDFPVTAHQLRHTYITRLVLAGVDVKTVQYLAGHASSATTMDIYAHLIGRRPEDLIGAVRGALGSHDASHENTPSLETGHEEIDAE